MQDSETYDVIQMTVIYRTNDFLAEFSSILIQTLTAGFIMGLILYAILCPFIITGLRSSLFRERFFLLLGLKPQQQPIDINPEEQAPENTD